MLKKLASQSNSIKVGQKTAKTLLKLAILAVKRNLLKYEIETGKF